ncbi:hypothetical protein QYQ99_26065 [Comamonas testosteroni]|uniref:hypothetical protein n=1 Tax=Comamonas testosteroni TaxID=285 RepID=UPI00265EF7AE|nr:hypothetical protein [Comamonas testosteroni]WKL15750.1 hypothetical protein QYQ99_26065 [Comamonas testosteroni]
MNKKSILERYLELHPLGASRRGASLDKELIERWYFEIQLRGVAKIKDQITHAKRTATSLVKAQSNFENLNPAQLKQLKDASTMMRNLAESLVPLENWAKSYKEFYDKTVLADQNEECDAFAQARWHGDEVEFQLELELLLEADNFKTRSCLGDWFHLNKRYLNVAANEFILSLYLTLHEKQSVKERMRAVAYSFVYASACRREHSELISNQKSVYVGTKDIDAYLAYRKANVQASASAAMGKLGVNL